MNKLITVIITCYNAEKTIQRAIISVQKTKRREEIEIIVVDDCSKDNSASKISELKDKYDNITVIALEQNTGSPSIPRNIGIENATGKFIAFLDDDDYLESDNLIEMADYANRNDLDFLHGYLKIVKNNEITIANRIVSPDARKINSEIIKNQSTTVDIIVRRDFLDKYNIRFDSEYKLAEDTLFYSKCFKNRAKTDYIDNYFIYYVKDSDAFNPSSTQNCTDAEVNNLLNAWCEIQKNFLEININYFEIRLHITFKHLILTIINFAKGRISKETFDRLHCFLKENHYYLRKRISLHPRFKEVYVAVLNGDYTAFKEVTKLRLLITGYDLKFILPLIPYFSEKYNVKTDEWTGHDVHNNRKSEKLLNQADIIWCEWMLGNTVWYSKRKMKHQTLLVRAHRFEIGTPYGFETDFNNVDAAIFIAYYYLETFIKQFNIPRHKANLISNYTQLFENKEKPAHYKYNISMVGILPKRKGFLRALTLLNRLVSYDKNFKLHIIGQRPEEVSWIYNDKNEKCYYEECYEYIKANNLSDNVIFAGFVKREDIYNNIGYTLSLSDHDKPESFHLSIAESAVADTLPLSLDWSGIEYIYPDNVFFKNDDEIYDKIISTFENDDEYKDLLYTVKDFVNTNYNCNRIVNDIFALIDKTRINLF